MVARTSAGTTIGIDQAPATNDQSGFEALTFVTIGEVTDLGEYGKEYALVTHTPLGDRQVKKFKGSYNNGSIAMQIAYNEVDLGQIDALAASATDLSYGFKVTLQNGAVDYFSAKVMSFKKSIGSVDSIESGTIQLEIDDDIIPIAAP